MKTKQLVAVLGAAVVLVGVAVLTNTYMASSDSGTIKLSGKGFSPSLNLEVKINAMKHKNGTVTGQSKVQENFRGKIVEVTTWELSPPPNPDGFWCVNLKVDGTTEFNNWLWYVKDMPSGQDQLSFASGFNLTCESAGSPVQPFEPITSGDFKAEFK